MIPEFQTHNGKVYRTNEVGGIDIATVEPTEPCPRCKAVMHADWVDNGFGPYAVQAGPYHCGECDWTEGTDCWKCGEPYVRTECARCGGTGESDSLDAEPAWSRCEGCGGSGEQIRCANCEAI